MGKSTKRVADAALRAGVEIEISKMPASTRTAADAAAACGCTEGQIVKSLIFAKDGGEDLVLLLVPGDCQVDLSIAAQAVGAPLTRADPKLVRAVTGFAIGGVAPIGHTGPVDAYIDQRFAAGVPLWAAAGAPDAVFQTDLATLLRLTGGRTVALG